MENARPHDDDTHGGPSEHRSKAKTQQTTGWPLPPCPTFLFPNLTHWCQIGIDRPQTASTNGCPQRAAGPTTLRFKYDPVTPRTGAKGSRTRLTLLQLRENGRRGWPDGPQRVTAEEEDRGLQPVDEECKAKEATQKSGYMKFKPKDDDGTHLKHRSAAKTRHKQACRSPLPPCPPVPLPQPETQGPIK